MTLRRTLCISIAILLGITFIIFGILVVFFFSALVDSVIAGRLPLRKDTDTFELWRKPPATPYLKVYFFNVTNYKEYLDGNHTKLILKEFGPYTYSEKWEKVEPIWHPNGTLSYRQNKIYKFEPEMSLGTEEDKYMLPNVPMLAALGSLKQSSKVARKAVATILEILNLRPFIERTVGEMVWGYDDPLLKLGKEVLPEGKRAPFEKFGFFYGRNNTPGQVLTVFTGQEKLADYAKIDVWDGKEQLPFWSNDSCNAIKGTDATGFPSMLNENSTIYIFNPELCQSVKLVYHHEVVHEELPAYRYYPAESTFGDVETYPENECFCLGGPPCSKRGTFNISACQFGSPVFLSWPHFLHGDKQLVEDLEGLHPDPNRHQFYIDIQPKLGIPMQAKARIQINIQISRIEDIKQAANLTNVLVPVIWFEDGIDSLPESVTSLIRVAVLVPPVAEQALSFVLFGLGGILIVCVLFYLIRSVCAARTYDSRSLKGGDVEKSNNGVRNGNNHHLNGSVEMEDAIKQPKNGHNSEKNGAIVESST